MVALDGEMLTVAGVTSGPVSPLPPQAERSVKTTALTMGAKRGKGARESVDTSRTAPLGRKGGTGLRR